MSGLKAAESILIQVSLPPAGFALRSDEGRDGRCRPNGGPYMALLWLQGINKGARTHPFQLAQYPCPMRGEVSINGPPCMYRHEGCVMGRILTPYSGWRCEKYQHLELSRRASQASLSGMDTSPHRMRDCSRRKVLCSGLFTVHLNPSLSPIVVETVFRGRMTPRAAAHPRRASYSTTLFNLESLHLSHSNILSSLATNELLSSTPPHPLTPPYSTLLYLYMILVPP